jgi:NAD(P)-dependent dehydrogenase (short-subunit alcohol dehydrogenase family)
MKNAKVWLITGASKGIGLALAKLALSKGDYVVATSRNIESFKTSINAHGDHFLPLTVDITNDAAVKEAVAKAMNRFGKLDIVVNNAGYSLVGSIEEASDEEFRQTIDVNLFGTVNVLRNTIPHLRAQICCCALWPVSCRSMSLK